MDRKVETEKIDDGDEDEDEFDVKTSGHSARSDRSSHEESIRDVGERFGDLVLVFRERLGDVNRSARIGGVVELAGRSLGGRSREGRLESLVRIEFGERLFANGAFLGYG